MKKIYVVLLVAILMAVSLAGCAQNAVAPSGSAAAPAVSPSAAASASVAASASAAASPAASGGTQLVVSAAASLTDVLKEIAQDYKAKAPDVTINFNFGASGTLEQQIEQGAPADIFMSAATKQMDALKAKNLIVSASDVNLLENTLVLVIPVDKDTPGSFESLGSVSQLAIGDPASVPAGQYAEQVLTHLGILDTLKADQKLVLASDVRTVLNWVETGNAQAGIVYSTDAKTSDKVKVVATATADSHDPIIYPAAVIAGSTNQAAAQAFLDYLSTPDITAVFEKAGFTALKK